MEILPCHAPYHFFDTEYGLQYYFAMCVVCFIISGTVKISVALVLYRLDNRPFMRFALILDIVTCSIWTVSTTLLVSLGCMERSPYYGIIDKTTCNNTTYSRESLQVIYDVLHVILPIMILWNVQISRGMKCSVVGLFSVELLAAGAAAIKLRNSYNGSHAHGNVDYVARGYQAMIWSTVEHGLSTFGSSVLALRPLLKFISKGWADLSSNLYSSGSLSWGHKSSRHTSRESNTSDPIGLSELGKVSVRNEVSIRNLGMAECHLQQPVYLAKAYTGTSGTYNRLIDGESQGNVGRGSV
ncbi:hypothetical protein N8I77_013181 [Diaporthe amygdali]|uniref:Rhodopsin domain-containing protein n=1 Tax=Phomopsis amygdali TaxID=1214568 RepID=A0AAD9VY16_PHOAM|nr:hypothetical protein N8I77_013181 [Diaporthe amygdali]